MYSKSKLLSHVNKSTLTDSNYPPILGEKKKKKNANRKTGRQKDTQINYTQKDKDRNRATHTAKEGYLKWTPSWKAPFVLWTEMK